MRDYCGEIEAIRFLSDRYFVLSVRCPDIARESEAGQFVMIEAGRTIDPLLRRPMAIYGIMRDGGTPIGITLLIERTGRGTRLMAEARPGDQTRVLGPIGQPFATAPGELEHLLVMGGVGAAPFPLLADRLRSLGARVRAFVGGRSRQNLLCEDDFEALGVPVVLATEDGSRGNRGLVTTPLLEYLERAGEVALYSCGPMGMMRAVDEIARARDIYHQVSLEAPMACGIGICLSCVVKVRVGDDWAYHRICREGPVFDASTVLWGA